MCLCVCLGMYVCKKHVQVRERGTGEREGEIEKRIWDICNLILKHFKSILQVTVFKLNTAYWSLNITIKNKKK